MEISFLDGKLIVYNNIKLNVPTKFGAQETLLVVLGEKNLNKSTSGSPSTSTSSTSTPRRNTSWTSRPHPQDFRAGQEAR